MPMHFIDQHGVTTVKHASERNFKYDLPAGAFDKSLEAMVERNYQSIERFQQTEDNVKGSGEWQHFISYLGSTGAPSNLVSYIDSDDKNYVCAPMPDRRIVAGTIPAHTTLTYVIPPDYNAKLQEFAYKYSLSVEQVETIVYLHEAIHNLLHDYRENGLKSTKTKEAEVESALTRYFMSRAAEASSSREKQYYQDMARVTQNRLQRLGHARAAYEAGRMTEQELAAIEDEVMGDIDSLSDSQDEHLEGVDAIEDTGEADTVESDAENSDASTE